MKQFRVKPFFALLVVMVGDSVEGFWVYGWICFIGHCCPELGIWIEALLGR